MPDTIESGQMASGRYYRTYKGYIVKCDYNVNGKIKVFNLATGNRIDLKPDLLVTEVTKKEALDWQKQYKKKQMYLRAAKQLEFIRINCNLGFDIGDPKCINLLSLDYGFWDLFKLVKEGKYHDLWQFYWTNQGNIVGDRQIMVKIKDRCKHKYTNEE